MERLCCTAFRAWFSTALKYDTAFTDDASVAEKMNIPLSYIEGERYNIKITTKDDLDFAKAILSLEIMV